MKWSVVIQVVAAVVPIVPLIVLCAAVVLVALVSMLPGKALRAHCRSLIRLLVSAMEAVRWPVDVAGRG